MKYVENVVSSRYNFPHPPHVYRYPLVSRRHMRARVRADDKSTSAGFHAAAVAVAVRRVLRR